MYWYRRKLKCAILLAFCCSIAVPANAGLVTSNTGGDQAHDNVQPSLALNYMIATQGTFPSHNLTAGDPGSGNLGTGPYIGGVGLFGGNFAPRGWAAADGQLLPISSNAALFSILGTTYGGDGRTTFALPDLRGRVPIQQGTGPGLPTYRLGARGGAERETLTQAQMPAHAHTASAPFETTGITGGGGGHSNMQPYLGMNYIINLQGTLPLTKFDRRRSRLGKFRHQPVDWRRQPFCRKLRTPRLGAGPRPVALHC